MDNSLETINAYNKIAKTFSESHKVTIYKEVFDKFLSLLPGKDVLEIGCGAGRDAELFVNAGCNYIGTDASEGMIEEAKKRISSAKFLVLDFYDLKFRDETFDGFWAAATFLHVSKKEVTKVIKEAVRVLKKGGIGFISVKEKTEFDEGMIEQKDLGISRYFAFYTSDEFKKILTKNKLQIIDESRVTENDDRKTVWLCYIVKK